MNLRAPLLVLLALAGCLDIDKRNYVFSLDGGPAACRTAADCGSAAVCDRSCTCVRVSAASGLCPFFPVGGGETNSGGGLVAGGIAGGDAGGGGSVGGGSVGGGFVGGGSVGGGSVGGGSVGGGSVGGGSVGGGSVGGGSAVNPCFTNNGGCDLNAQCTNVDGAPQCTCLAGWTGSGFSCTDVNECATGNGGCDSNATCTNTPGSHSCACRSGFMGSGTVCTDVDECSNGTAGCSLNAICTNLTGSFSCACRSGFTGNGVTCTRNPPTWMTETVAFSGGSHSALALDSAGNPTVAYHSDSPRGVYLRRRTTSWSGPETVDPAVNALEPSLAASSTFIVANSLTTVASTIMTSVSTWKRSTSSASWSPENSLTGYERPDLAVGGGREHLVAVVRSGGTIGQVGYSSRLVGSTTWSAPTVIGMGGGGFGPKVSANSGLVVALFSRSPDGLLLARSSNNGSTWTTTTVTTLRAWSWDIALDPGGTAFLVYYTPDNGHRIILESYSGLSRTQQAVVDTPLNSGAGSMWFSGLSIAQSPLGVTHAAWLDFTRGSVVRHTSNASGPFITSTVTSSDDVLGQTGLVVDTNEAVHLTYPAPSSSFSNLGYAVLR